MICPKCKFEQSDESIECVRCGIIYEKYSAQQNLISKKTSLQRPPESLAIVEESGISRTIDFVKELLLYVKPQINPFYFGGRVLFLLIIFIWGWKFILTPLGSNYAGRSFLHLVNLPFHEAGHVIFRPFGQFMMMLGGSAGQLLVPLICFLSFLLKTRDTFAASVSLWWLGESCMDLAPYINDARDLRMILLGGVTGRDVADYHDWEFILRKLGLLRYDHTLAHIANTIGILLMLTTFIWAGYLLFRQFKNIER